MVSLIKLLSAWPSQSNRHSMSCRREEEEAISPGRGKGGIRGELRGELREEEVWSRKGRGRER